MVTLPSADTTTKPLRKTRIELRQSRVFAPYMYVVEKTTKEIKWAKYSANPCHHSPKSDSLGWLRVKQSWFQSRKRICSQLITAKLKVGQINPGK